MQGTWCDALFVQAVANCQNVAIHIIEETLIEPHYLAQHPPTTIYLGHLDELHYVSTAAVTCGSDALGNQQVRILGQQSKMFFLKTTEEQPKKKTRCLQEEGLRPVKVLNAN